MIKIFHYYKTIEAELDTRTSREVFDESVGELLDEGWELHGQLAVVQCGDSVYGYQTLVKNQKVEDDD